MICQLESAKTIVFFHLKSICFNYFTMWKIALMDIPDDFSSPGLSAGSRATAPGAEQQQQQQQQQEQRNAEITHDLAPAHMHARTYETKLFPGWGSQAN